MNKNFNSLTALVLFSTLLLPIFSQAEETKNYLLMGRGFTDENQNEVIALACITQECKSVRFVHFHDSTSSFIGDTIFLPEAPTPKLREKAISLVIEEFFYTHHTLATASTIDRAQRNRGIIALGTVGLVGCFVATAGLGVIATVAIAGAAESVALTSIIITNSTKSMNRIVSGKKATASLDDQNNWNWSITPKKIKQKTFDTLLLRIQQGVKISNFSVPDSYSRSRQIEKKISDRKNKLMDHGVTGLNENSWGYHSHN